MAKSILANVNRGIILKGAIALAAFGLTYYALKGNKASAMSASAYEASTTEYTTVDGFKNKILEKIYNGAMNPTAVIQNVEALKSEVNNYTTQITTLIAEYTAGRIQKSTLDFYCNSIAEEIAKKLNIELRPFGYGGPYGGYDGNGGYGSGNNGNHYGWRNKWKNWGGGYGGYGNYGDSYQQYLDAIMQYYQQLMGGGYYQPNYGYSYGYGYQQPNLQPYYPTQNYNYYPQYPGSYNTPNQGFAYIPGQQYMPGVYY